MITDADDDRLDPYRSLRGRPADEGTFVIEGLTTLRQAMAAGVSLRSALVLSHRADDVADLEVPVHLVDRHAMTAITGYDVHRGVLALADRPPARTVDDVVREARVVVAMEGLTDAENVGAVFRNAAAFGAEAVVLDPTCSDPLLRRTVRVSVGNVLHVPWARATTWPLALDGVPVLALTPSGEDDVTALVEPPERYVLLVGAEGDGLSDAALASADRRLRIPMAPGVDSLNVATAAAVALSHLRRTGAS
ncbi:MAG TPA: RNA methyltransferase [Acidimicrobiales bacterium]|nr:RNA methyltransferase [Acidimicrobiales bacterium]